MDAVRLSLALLIKRRKKKKRTLWLRPFLQRNERGVYRQLLEELRLEGPEHHRRYLRMDTATFEVSKLVSVHSPLVVS